MMHRFQTACVAIGIVLSGFVCLPLPVLAQENDPIATDRPDFTESALVVPYRYLQIESGFTYENSRRVYTLSGSETLLRYGAGRRFELRLGLPNYLFQRADGSATSGFGDLYLGAKFQLGPTRNGWDISLIPAVYLPTGKRAFTSGTIDPEIKLCVSKELTARWIVSGMLYASWATEASRRNPALQSTLSLGYDLGRRWSVFFEYAGTFSERNAPQHLYHSGFAYQLNQDAQIDLHYGFGINRDAPDSFVAAGFSIRFGPR